MSRYDDAAHPTHSFVLRVWIEEQAHNGRGAIWRGQIIHVQTGARGVFTGIVDIHRFLVDELAAVGVRLGISDRVRLLLMKPR
jgi:hypothetical protein